MSYRAGVVLPSVEVRFHNINVSSKIAVGGRALPTLPNSVMNFIEVMHAAILSSLQYVTLEFPYPHAQHPEAFDASTRALSHMTGIMLLKLHMSHVYGYSCVYIYLKAQTCISAYANLPRKCCLAALKLRQSSRLMLSYDAVLVTNVFM